MAELFGRGGALATRFDGFEERRARSHGAGRRQLFGRGGRLLVEAGTGTGKTFAYCCRRCWHAELPDRRVVISTWTRTLQEQLVGRDLPRLRELLNVPLEAALVQGRENYVCRRRAELSLHRSDLLFERRLRARSSRRSSTGRRAPRSARRRPRLRTARGVWAAVRAERGNCLHRARPSSSRVSGRRRAHARDAGVLVVNHALLLET